MVSLFIHLDGTESVNSNFTTFLEVSDMLKGILRGDFDSISATSVNI